MSRKSNGFISVEGGRAFTPRSSSRRAKNKARKRGEIQGEGKETKSNTKSRTVTRKKVEKQTGVYHAWVDNKLVSLGTRIDSTPHRPKYTKTSCVSNWSGHISTRASSLPFNTTPSYASRRPVSHGGSHWPGSY